MSADTVYLGNPASGGTRNPFNYEKIQEIGRDNSTAWLTLEEVTQHLNLVDDESQDAYITSLELATRQAIEDYLGLSILPITYRVWYGASSLYGQPVALDLPEVSQNVNPANPGVTVSKVAYWNSSEQLITMDGASYSYHASRKTIIVTGMPTDLSYTKANPIYAEYTTAANPLSAYPVIKQAALLMLTHLYNNRSESNDRIIRTIPFGVTALLNKYKPLVM